MKSSEIRELSLKEIEERIESEENMLVRLKMNHAVSPLDNPNKIPETRKNIARLKTELQSRLIKEQSESNK
ncbi:MAG: 50S ribosomal protein L29 [Bacteroidales bacterium]|nr:50S ribosomal protein L29 [Bacteroidales bacterium]MBN2698141.1 50S ribosomal protein L29 [Bacteroidales bacterium]